MSVLQDSHVTLQGLWGLLQDGHVTLQGHWGVLQDSYVTLQGHWGVPEVQPQCLLSSRTVTTTVDHKHQLL